MEYRIFLSLEEYCEIDGVLNINPKIVKDNEDEEDYEYEREDIGEIDAYILPKTDGTYENVFENVNAISDAAIELLDVFKDKSEAGDIKLDVYKNLFKEVNCYIDKIEIIEDERRKGYGSKALDELFKILKGFGVSGVYLIAKSKFIEGDDLNRFYEEKGFSLVHKNYNDGKLINTFMFKYLD
ncbi:GNAT family N-acetyltransferase [Romboutsia lituseburensis]|uniref:GNAT family N-acetyltransferase n=1 Tax=Romboutsia lituseburensis TaxID=1537 RepID=UPI00215A3B81|nr:GNAT family N-acetyltransferase [Romboutsia lituseburensis]MCR8744496.1 GNAT family N-acetyltransferase [Romboutsia lituseburensis]